MDVYSQLYDDDVNANGYVVAVDGILYINFVDKPNRKFA